MLGLLDGTRKGVREWTIVFGVQKIELTGLKRKNKT
jgi:hypothetical protein